jgi:hypothetical protein
LFFVCRAFLHVATGSRRGDLLKAFDSLRHSATAFPLCHYAFSGSGVEFPRANLKSFSIFTLEKAPRPQKANYINFPLAENTGKNIFIKFLLP